MVLGTSLFNTQQYKVPIEGKVEQSKERSSAFPYTSVEYLLKREPSGRPRLKGDNLHSSNLALIDKNLMQPVEYLRSYSYSQPHFYLTTSLKSIFSKLPWNSISTNMSLSYNYVKNRSLNFIKCCPWAMSLVITSTDANFKDSLTIIGTCSKNELFKSIAEKYCCLMFSHISTVLSYLWQILLVNIYMISLEATWYNGYRRRKWTRWQEFKSWTRLIAFLIALILFGKVWI